MIIYNINMCIIATISTISIINHWGVYFPSLILLTGKVIPQYLPHCVLSTLLMDQMQGGRRRCSLHMNCLFFGYFEVASRVQKFSRYLAEFRKSYQRKTQYLMKIEHPVVLYRCGCISITDLLPHSLLPSNVY